MGRTFYNGHFIFTTLCLTMGIWAYLDESIPAPKDDKAQVTWNQNNPQVVTWLLNFVEPNTELSLHSFEKTSEM